MPAALAERDRIATTPSAGAAVAETFAHRLIDDYLRGQAGWMPRWPPPGGGTGRAGGGEGGTGQPGDGIHRRSTHRRRCGPPARSVRRSDPGDRGGGHRRKRPTGTRRLAWEIPPLEAARAISARKAFMLPGEPRRPPRRPSPGNPRPRPRQRRRPIRRPSRSSSTRAAFRVAVDRLRSWPRRTPRFTLMCGNSSRRGAEDTGEG